MTEHLKKFLKKNGIDQITMADVGAKDKLEFVPELAGITEMHAFEPNPVEFEKLQTLYRQHRFKTLRLNATALGSENGNASFKITKHASMSSLLEPDLENYSKHFGSYKEFDFWKNSIEKETEISIRIQTADDYFKDTNIDYLKLDTQGSELSILKGAQKLIARKGIQVIKTEVSTVPVYKNQALFSDIDLFLRRHNYVLVDFVTYRNDYTPIINTKHLQAHYAPCGDAIYVLQNNAEPMAQAIKKGMILHWLGYNSIAGFYFNLAGLNTNDIDAICSIRKTNHKPLYKRLIKNSIPPLAYRLIKRIIWRLKK